MYGLVNKAVADMVCQEFDEDTWLSIKREAGVDTDVFLSMQQYPDQVTYELVGAASALLGAPAEEILKAFGRYWVTYTAQEGYGALLNMSGRDLGDFLSNLDHMHARVALSFPNLEPPSFVCEEDDDGDMTLHYYSERAGLAPLVHGLIEGLGDRFETQVRVELSESRAEGADHDVFRIRYVS